MQVNVKRSVKGRDSTLSNENGNVSHISRTIKLPVVRKAKLVVVDLAGSERIDKSGMCCNLWPMGIKKIFTFFILFPP